MRARNWAFRRRVDGTSDGVSFAADLDRGIPHLTIQLLERQLDGRHALKQFGTLTDILNRMRSWQDLGLLGRDVYGFLDERFLSQ
ncbi:MAG: hypothetical protein E6H72_14470 [Betaproteobacteria bacterium]|nr:MAG: hypothetical protein E6H72_14470 [Betaproteobacteria bacterium]